MESTQNSSPSETSDDLVVKNKMGIHARPAAMIVRVANKFTDCELWISKDGEQINGKSIMGLMMLAAGKGSTLKVTAIGPSGPQLLAELSELFERSFEEA